MASKIKIRADLTRYGFNCHIFMPIPPREIDELHWYVDDISGDGRGLD